MQYFNIVGIDPGSTTLGLGLLECDYTSLEIRHTHMITISAYDVYQSSLMNLSSTQADLSALDRIELISKALLYRLADMNPSIITVEEPFFNRFRPGAFKPLVVQVESIKSKCKVTYPNIPLIGYAPMEIKRGSGATSMKGKEPMYEAIMSNKEIMNALVQHPDSITEHAIDGIGCAYTCLGRLRKKYCK